MTRAEQLRRFGSVIQPVEAPEVVLGAAGGKRFSRRKMPSASETSWLDLFAGCVLAAFFGIFCGSLAIEAMTQHNAARIYQEAR